MGVKFFILILILPSWQDLVLNMSTPQHKREAMHQLRTVAGNNSFSLYTIIVGGVYSILYTLGGIFCGNVLLLK